MSDSNNETKTKAGKRAGEQPGQQTSKPASKKAAPRKRAPRKRKTDSVAPAQDASATTPSAQDPSAQNPLDTAVVAAPQAVARESAAAPAREAQPAHARAASAPPASPQPAAAQMVESFAVAPATLIRVPLSVRWRDLDAFNHVNNSKFLSYLEEARLRWMVTLPGHGMDEHVAPVVAAAHLNYRRPIEWPNEIDIELFVERLGNTSLSIGHRIVGADDPSALYCEGNVVMVWIHRETGQPSALPEPVRRACTTA